MINLDCSEHRVIEVRTICDTLFVLAVERNSLVFSPGDCVALYTEHDRSRPYSIASGASENELRFVIRMMAGGEVSPWLMTRRPGDFIRISPPFGWFRPGQDIGESSFVFIATGTGIAPFLSYAETFSKVPECCLFGVRREADAVGLSTLKKLCSTHLAVSREKTQHHCGRVTDLLEAILPLNAETHYYCCGLESMILHVSEWLQRHGITLAQIHREVFFHG